MRTETEGEQNTGQVGPQRVCLGVPLSLGPAPLLYSVAPSFLIVPVSWCHFLKVQTPPEKQSLHGVVVVVVFVMEQGTGVLYPISVSVVGSGLPPNSPEWHPTLQGRSPSLSSSRLVHHSLRPATLWDVQ